MPLADPRRRPVLDEAPPTPTAPAAEVHHSLALAPALAHLERRQSPRLLDLGPARAANIEVFSTLASRLSIADLFAELPASLDPEDEETPRRFEAALARALPRPRHGPFDLVLAWDLFNYLTRPQIASLARQLTPLIAPGALVFALVATRGDQPVRPLHFEIRGPQALLYRATTAATRPAPRYKEPDLLRLLPGFRVDSSFLLRHGIQEYLFVHQPCPPGEGSAAGSPPSATPGA